MSASEPLTENVSNFPNNFLPHNEPTSNLQLHPTSTTPSPKKHKPKEPLIRPLPKHDPDRGTRYSIVQRIQALTLMAEGFKANYIRERTGMKVRAQHHLKRRAKARGFNPAEDPRVLEFYVEEGKRTGRPPKKKLLQQQLQGKERHGAGEGGEARSGVDCGSAPQAT